jgi:hypothetical protein
MTKRMLAVLFLICGLMVVMGGSESAPAAGAPTTPSVTAPTAPALNAPTEPGWGGCRWYCGSKSYLTATECAAKCSVACEQIC